MNKFKENKQQGYSLLELLLVAVVLCSMLMMLISYQQQHARQDRITKTVQDMQQILAAAMTYYVANPPTPTNNPTQGGWPPPGKGATAVAEVTALTCLHGQQAATIVTGCLPDPPRRYLPQTIMLNPWQQYYRTGVAAPTLTALSTIPSFYVWTAVTQPTGSSNAANYAAAAIANQLPGGYTTSSPPPLGVAGQLPAAPPSDGLACTSTTTTCYVVASINAPPQILNKNTTGASGAASSPTIVRFAGVYKHGGCVPVPTCPGDTPKIYVLPTSVSGLGQSGGIADPNTLYGLVSFTAYATAPAAVDNSSNPVGCNGAAATPCSPTGAPVGTPHWRVCLQIVTDHGVVSGTNWGQYVDLLAFTRCSPAAGELSGSSTAIFSN